MIDGAGGSVSTSVSSSTSGASSGTGGASSSTSAVSSASSGTGGAVSSSSTSSSSTSGTGGAGATSSSASSGASSSASSASSSGAVGGADCSALAGLSPGQVVWTKAVSVSTAETLAAPAVGTTGHIFFSGGQRQLGFGEQPATVTVDEWDAWGAPVGSHPGISGITTQLLAPYTQVAVFGAGNYVVNASWKSGSTLGYEFRGVIRDEGTAIAQEAANDAVSYPYQALTGTGNAAGDLFLAYVGVYGAPGQLTRVDVAGTTVYSKALPGSPGFTSATPDDTGDVYVGGEISGTLDVGCGPFSGTGPFIAKLDPAGQCLWSRPVGTDAAIKPAGASAFLAGIFTGSIDLGCGPMTSGSSAASYVAELGPSGACAWSRIIPATEISVPAVVAGEPIVAGQAAAGADLGCGPLGAGTVVARLDASGACVWSHAFPLSYASFAAMPSGDVALSTPFSGTIDLGAGPIVAPGSEALAVARLDGITGDTLWSESLSGPWGQSTLLADVLDGLLVVGAAGTTRLDATGAIRWHQVNARAGLDDCGAAIVISPPGGSLTYFVSRIAP
ncbi:Cellobiohydrolase II [Minicystis rosea]|nr:Cellobiohydrolase II [Minicystis rosea]